MMFWSITQILTLFLDFFLILGSSDSSKDLEIIPLRQQVRILQRKMKTPPRISVPEKMILATLTYKILQTSKNARELLQQVMLIFKPDTVLGWHRGLVRRKWRFNPSGKKGRPRLSSELEALIVKLARENARWGYEKIQGELLKLGYKLSVSSVRNILKRHRITPSPQRSTGSWRSLMKHYRDQILACDFFTVETIWLKTIYVLFFIELGTRRIHLAGCTSNPNQIWLSQQARQ
jgi:putative transposase